MRYAIEEKFWAGLHLLQVQIQVTSSSCQDQADYIARVDATCKRPEKRGHSPLCTETDGYLYCTPTTCQSLLSMSSIIETMTSILP